MSRLRLVYRRASDDPETQRVALTPAGYVFSFGHERTPVLVPVSEVVAVELVDDEADPLAEKSIRNLHIVRETGTL